MFHHTLFAHKHSAKILSGVSSRKPHLLHKMFGTEIPLLAKETFAANLPDSARQLW
ncbi:hypothetical protein Hanom_Chr11g00989141 [Helianthus anomalus]